MRSCVFLTREAAGRSSLRVSAIGGVDSAAVGGVVSPRARVPAACTRGLTVIGTALTPRVHAVQVDSCSLAGTTCLVRLEKTTMSLRFLCLLIG